jgi:hypothetical protein
VLSSWTIKPIIQDTRNHKPPPPQKRRLSALPNVGPYIYTTLKFLALQGAPHIYIYIYGISRLRDKQFFLLSCFLSVPQHLQHALHLTLRNSCVTLELPSTGCVTFCLVLWTRVLHEVHNCRSNPHMPVSIEPHLNYGIYMYYLFCRSSSMRVSYEEASTAQHSTAQHSSHHAVLVTADTVHWVCRPASANQSTSNTQLYCTDNSIIT